MNLLIKKIISATLISGVLLSQFSLTIAQGEDTQSQTYLNQNNVLMFKTGFDYDIRMEHPRFTIKKEELPQVLTRMYGTSAIEPYKSLFLKIKTLEDTSGGANLPTLAVLYLATQDEIYKTKFLQKIPKTGVPSYYEILGLDLMYEFLDDTTKKLLLKRASSGDFHYNVRNISQGKSSWGESWGYHGFHIDAMLFANLFAFDPILQDPEVVANPLVYQAFNVNNYLKLSLEAIGPNGKLRKIEKRVGGDPSLNDGIAGEYGGMYDNFGYDASEEAESSLVVSHMTVSTDAGTDLLDGFLRDKYRGQFYQSFGIPHTLKQITTDGYCVKAGGIANNQASIWSTQSSDSVSQPKNITLAQLNYVYKDPRLQYFQNRGTQTEMCGNAAILNDLFLKVLYYDVNIPEQGPESLPRSQYFTGPGLVSIKSDTSSGATFGVFASGDGLSRRYEDANSFLLSKNAAIAPHAGARIRNTPANDKHHWYAKRSMSKNTLRIYDPNESFDFNTDGTRGELYTGPKMEASKNFGGQLWRDDFPTGVVRKNSPLLGDFGHDYGKIEKYEFVPGEYTYSLGDATAAYSKKIDFFKREFVFLDNENFIVFDKVQSVDPNFKKVWTMHTVGVPEGNSVLVGTGLGVKSYQDNTLGTIRDEKNITYVDTLLPKQNITHIRGGDSVLVNAPLSSSNPITSIKESDIPRWAEIFAVGNDFSGSVVIEGETDVSANDTETVVFNGKEQVELLVSKTTKVEATKFVDAAQNWKIDQWKGYMVRTSGTANYVEILGNNENTIFANFPKIGNAWQYQIGKPLANTKKNWKKITKISTQDMDVKYLTVSVPHYFDTVDVNGKVHTFAPNTDYDKDVYKKNKSYGQYTYEVEATQPQKLDNFLTIISPKNIGEQKEETKLIEGENISGVFMKNTAIVFANSPENIQKTQLELSHTGVVNYLIFNTQPNTQYFYKIEQKKLELSTSQISSNIVTSTQAGVISLKNIELKEENPYQACLKSGQILQAKSVYPGVSIAGKQPLHGACDLPDTIVCSGEKTGYTISTCNVGATAAREYSLCTGSSTCTTQRVGYYFQWGRNKSFTGSGLKHATLLDGSVGLNASTDENGFVSFSSILDNWENTNIDNNWGGLTQDKIQQQGPCADGYHVPTIDEWQKIYTAGGWGRNVLQLSTDLKMPRAGYRWRKSGNMMGLNSSGEYWSSTPAPNNRVYSFTFTKAAMYNKYDNNRANGFSVRCMKND